MDCTPKKSYFRRMDNQNISSYRSSKVMGGEFISFFLARFSHGNARLCIG